MSKKEGYIPTKEGKMQAKEDAEQTAFLKRLKKIVEERRTGGSFSFKGLNFEMVVGEVCTVEGAAIIEAIDETKLAEYVRRCLANIELARQRMSNDQIEIDRLREETRSLISDLMVA